MFEPHYYYTFEFELFLKKMDIMQLIIYIIIINMI